jgi:very-short-patch-repair endonuclease
VREPDGRTEAYDIGAPRIRKTVAGAADQGRGHPWERLRGSRFFGAKFRRQVPFDSFVVDFYCHSVKLVAELDGAQHASVADYDVGRSEILQSHGVRVIRFTNEEVCGDIDSVLARIRTELRIPFG